MRKRLIKGMNKKGLTFFPIMLTAIFLCFLIYIVFPWFLSMVEFARSTEALRIMASLRNIVEHCYLTNGGRYDGCFHQSKLEQFNDAHNAHFRYHWTLVGHNEYNIVATRNSNDGGNIGDQIHLRQSSHGLDRWGTGKFASIH